MKRDIRRELNSLGGEAGGAYAFLRGSLRVDTDAFLTPVILDITTGCNLSCVFCSNTTSTRRELAGEALRDAIVAHVLPHTSEISIGCRHEAMLHPDLAPWLRTWAGARQTLPHQPLLGLLTSGSLLSPVDNRALTRSGVDIVQLSISTTHQATYAAIRSSTTWAEVRPRLATFVREALEDGVRVGVLALLFALTLPHMVASCEELIDLGITSIRITQMVYDPKRTGLPVASANGELPPQVLEVVARLEELAARRNVEIACPRRGAPPVGEDLAVFSAEGTVWNEHLLSCARRAVCTAPWTKLRVDHQGYVYPCQMMLNRQFAWGNVLDTPLPEIINADHAVRMRQALLAGEPLPSCAHCPFAGGVEP
jgi:radical SAM protein with 4Fe4S-binding SPASM domain